MPRRFRAPRRPVKSLGPDCFRLMIDDEERALVARLFEQLRGLVTEAPAADPRLRRLFPTAYHDDPERDVEYQRLMRDELLASRLASLAEVEQVLTREFLTSDQLASFMRSLNAVRLVLGTQLDVGEDTDPSELDQEDPLFVEHQLYAWLSWMLEHVVGALRQGLA